MRVPWSSFLWVSVAAALCVPPARATDGVFEINQAMALAGGVTPADSAGFPVTIMGGGSFRLTGDLDLRFLGGPAANTDAIVVTGGPSVTIDLNGFSIIGPANCNTFPCLNTGTGVGIRSSTSGAVVTVRNGTIVGAGSYGLYLSSGTSRVDSVSVSDNGEDGMYIGRGLVLRSIATRNGGNGINVFQAVVENCVGFNNFSYQINVENGTVAHSTAESSNGAAVRVGFGLVNGSHVKTIGELAALDCSSRCALANNNFSPCQGAACFTGMGFIVQVPTGSNMCGDTTCP